MFFSLMIATKLAQAKIRFKKEGRKVSSKETETVSSNDHPKRNDYLLVVFNTRVYFHLQCLFACFNYCCLKTSKCLIGFGGEEEEAKSRSKCSTWFRSFVRSTCTLRKLINNKQKPSKVFQLPSLPIAFE